MKPPQAQSERRDVDVSPANKPRAPSGPAGEPGGSFKSTFRDASYYSTGRDWADYAPAYRYGYEAFSRHHHAHPQFEDIERVLEQNWDDARQRSRLVWVEARNAVRDAWRQAENEASEQAHMTSGSGKSHH
jgi:hypothetical protein